MSAPDRSRGQLAERFTRSIVAAAPPPPTLERLATHRPPRPPRRGAALAASLVLVAGTVAALVVLPGSGDEQAGTTATTTAPETTPAAGASDSWDAEQVCIDEPERFGCPALPTRESIARFSLAVALGYTTEERVTIRRAWNQLYVACVAEAEPESVTRYGDDAPLLVPDPDWQYEADQLNFDNLDLIATTGYQWQLDPAPPTSGYRGEYFVMPSDAVENACKHAANEPFGGAPMGDVDNALAAADQALRTELLDGSERLREAEVRWAHCMGGLGYPGREFADPRRVLRFSGEPEASGDEIAEALADADCRVASGHTAIRNDIIATGVQQWQGANADTVAGIRATIDREVAVAEQVLASNDD